MALPCNAIQKALPSYRYGCKVLYKFDTLSPGRDEFMVAPGFNLGV